MTKPPFETVNWSKQKIGYWARQPLPGLSYEERCAEIQLMLWRAYETWDGRQAFDAFVPMVWHRTKYNIIRLWVRKLERVQLTDFYDDALTKTFADVMIPQCPLSDPLIQKIWALLALGFSPRNKPPNILSILDISLRSYYGAIEQLRTAIVRDVLVG
jgi:hypothetical protein